MPDDLTRWKRAQEQAREGAKRGRRLVSIFYARPVGRALRRYIDSNGNVLAGGVAYYSLASVAAALVLAVTVASIIVVGNETYRDAVLEFVGNAIPGIFIGDDGTGLVDPDSLKPTPMSGLVGVIALGVLLYTATRYMRGMRAATRTMLGDASAKSLPGTLRDVIALIALALVALLAAAIQIVGGFLVDAVTGWIGNQGVSAVSVWGVAAIAAYAADVAFVAIVFLVLGSARAPFRVLATTIALTGAVVWVLQYASGYFVSSAGSNPVLAPFAAVIALLIFVDFTARSMLVAAAWIGVAAGSPTAGSAGLLPSPSRRGRGSVTTRRATGAPRRDS
jgi:membrane protein